MKTIAVLNNKGGVGKTSLIYHLVWMYAELGKRVIAADLDPQANLTTMFLDEERLEELWPDNDDDSKSIYGALQPLFGGTGDIAKPHIETISDKIGLLAGDLRLFKTEDELNSQWSKCLEGNERAFRVISAFYRLIYQAAQEHEADIVLIDVGPNLGAINRAALIASDFVITPVAPDIFSLQGLRNLGPTLLTWRKGWQDRLKQCPAKIESELPEGNMKPAGYIIQQHLERLSRPIKSYARWIKRIPLGYHCDILNDSSREEHDIDYENDPYCLALLKNYRSLMPMAQEARKPIFLLKPADGVFGGHVSAAKECGKDFKKLADKISERCLLK